MYLVKIKQVVQKLKERVKKSGVNGLAMKAAQNINKSLSELGDVIEASWKKHNHIP